MIITTVTTFMYTIMIWRDICGHCIRQELIGQNVNITCIHTLNSQVGKTIYFSGPPDSGHSFCPNMLLIFPLFETSWGNSPSCTILLFARNESNIYQMIHDILACEKIMHLYCFLFGIDAPSTRHQISSVWPPSSQATLTVTRVS